MLLLVLVRRDIALLELLLDVVALGVQLFDIRSQGLLHFLFAELLLLLFESVRELLQLGLLLVILRLQVSVALFLFLDFLCFGLVVLCQSLSSGHGLLVDALDVERSILRSAPVLHVLHVVLHMVQLCQTAHGKLAASLIKDTIQLLLIISQVLLQLSAAICGLEIRFVFFVVFLLDHMTYLPFEGRLRLRIRDRLLQHLRLSVHLRRRLLWLLLILRHLFRHLLRNRRLRVKLRMNVADDAQQVRAVLQAPVVELRNANDLGHIVHARMKYSCEHDDIRSRSRECSWAVNSQEQRCLAH